MGSFLVTLDQDLRSSADSLHGKFTECLYGYLTNPTDIEIQTAFEHFQLLKGAKKTLILHTKEFGNQFNEELRSIHRNFHLTVHLENTKLEFPIIPSSEWRGKHLKVYALYIWPFLSQDEDGSMSGADWDLINGLLEHYGMTFNMVRSTKLSTTLLENGTTYGYLYEIQNRRYDLGIGQLTITRERGRYLDFTRDMFQRELGFASQPLRRAGKPETLILPFDNQTWLFLIACLFTITFFLMFIAFIDEQLTPHDCYESFIMAFSPLVQESQPPRLFYKFKFSTRRFFLGSWLITGGLLAMFYDSNLLATMTTVNYAKPIDTPKEIIASGLPVFVSQGNIFQTAFTQSPIPIYQELYRKSTLEKGALYVSSNGGAEERERMVDEGKAIETLTRVRANNNPKRRYHSESFFIGTTAWVVSKGSHMKNVLDWDILKLQEAGIMFWLEKRHVELRRANQGRGSNTEFQRLSLELYQPTYVTWGVGIGMSVVAFLVEMLMRAKPKPVNQA
ncbi:uncharacterized protein LOC131877509 [Tigriopus californicus]|nr:uncharacterized protein LOC131877509 [Tigriopus californicus]